MRWAPKVDANQRAIIDALEAHGASVEFIGRPVDLLVGYRGQTWVVEVKDGKKAASRKTLTPIQEKFFARWRGGPAAKVESVEEALELIGVAVVRAHPENVATSTRGSRTTRRTQGLRLK